MRAALGAGRERLVRQGLVLGLAAGAVGWLLCPMAPAEALMPQAATLTGIKSFQIRVCLAFVAGAIAGSVLAGLARVTVGIDHLITERSESGARNESTPRAQLAVPARSCCGLNAASPWRS